MRCACVSSNMRMMSSGVRVLSAAVRAFLCVGADLGGVIRLVTAGTRVRLGDGVGVLYAHLGRTPHDACASDDQEQDLRQHQSPA